MQAVVVCQVIDRNIQSTMPDTVFNAKAALLQQYLCMVLENEPGIFLWDHRDFGNVNSQYWQTCHANVV